MTKSQLLEALQNYPDDAGIEIVQYGNHYDIEQVLSYNDNGVIIAELGIFDIKTVPESVVRNAK